MGSLGYLAAAAHTSADAVWVHDLEAGTSRRTVGDVVTNFTIVRERSVDPVEALPDAAVADTWYRIVRRGTLNLKADGDTDELVNDLAFEQLVCELKYTVVDGVKSTHGHYGEAYEKVSKWKKKTFYKCWACEGTQVLAKLLRRAVGSAEETVVSESVVGLRHDRKGYIQDFTNPESQDYGTDKLTPAPDGIGGVNKQAFENTLKAFGKKLGF